MSSKFDVIIDPFRPMVMENLGLGPEKLCRLNPRLIYTRLSGYGQTGPWANKASHDINFIALSGVMSRLGYKSMPPIAPINLLGDFAAGSALCALAVVMALYERENSGLGQIIDHSMTEGLAYLSSFYWESLQKKQENWPNWPKRERNLYDFGAPFNRCYQCLDGKFISVGALENKCYSNFTKVLAVDESEWDRDNANNWPAMNDRFSKIIQTKTCKEWMELFDSVDACVMPVLEIDQVSELIKYRSKDSFDEQTGYPNAAPKLSRTPSIVKHKNMDNNFKTNSILQELGYGQDEIEQLFSNDITI